jgi:hypothetical protein
VRKTHSREEHVKEDVKELLKAYNAWYVMPIGGAFSTGGIPDFLAVVNGTMFGIETKFGSNKPTPMQQRQLTLIEQAGGIGLVITEKNLSVLEEQLKKASTNARYTDQEKTGT